MGVYIHCVTAPSAFLRSPPAFGGVKRRAGGLLRGLGEAGEGDFNAEKSIFLGIDRAVGQGYTRALYLPQDRRRSSSTEWAGGFHRCRVADEQDPRHRVAMVSSRGR